MENTVPGKCVESFFKQSDFSVSKKWRIFTADELTQIRKLIINDLKQRSVEDYGSKSAIQIESYTGMRIGEF